MGIITALISLTLSTCWCGGNTSYNIPKNRSTNITYLDLDVDTPTSIIDNHFYFEKLSSNHSKNTNNTCTLVAAEILLSYYDSFVSDDIVPEEYEFKSHGVSNDISRYAESPGSGKGEENRYLHDELADLAYNYPEMSIALYNDLGLTDIQLGIILEDYINEHDLSASVTQSYLLNRTSIEYSIDSNRPILVSNAGHSMVAYAYSDDYVWVHTDHYRCGVLPWSEFTKAGAGWITFNYSGDHVCSDNYVNDITHQSVCPVCDTYGYVTIHPEDFGFGGNYVSSMTTTDSTIHGLSVHTQRYRCGYINEEYVNVSPKKYYYGSAYLMVFFGQEVTDFYINLSYWQVLDVLNPQDSSAIIRFADEDGSWENNFLPVVDLLTLNLPTDRTNQMTLHYTFSSSNPITGFWLDTQAPATGDRNLGRIAIGDITVKAWY